MPVNPIPEGFHTATPYLVVPGVAKLVDFLTKAFGAVESPGRSTRSDGSVMHTQVKIGDSMIMMGEPVGAFTAMPSMIHLYVQDADATYQRALDAGATVVMELSDQFYGDRSRGVKGPSGNLWWIATHVEEIEPEEMAKRAAAEMEKQEA